VGFFVDAVNAQVTPMVGLLPTVPSGSLPVRRGCKVTFATTMISAGGGKSSELDGVRGVSARCLSSASPWDARTMRQRGPLSLPTPPRPTPITTTAPTFGVWVDAELADLLLEEVGVTCLAGTALSRQGEGHLRLSYANSRENIGVAAIERRGKILSRVVR
jgi:hypothetical protein